MWNKKFVYVLSFLKIFKEVHKSNSWMYSLQKNKKTKKKQKSLLTAPVYFKTSNPVISQRERVKNVVSGIKQKCKHQHWILHIWFSLGIKFKLNCDFWIVGPNLSKNNVSSLKQKKWTVLSNSAFSNYSRHRIPV